MKIFTYQPSAVEYRQLKIEIMYNISSARALGYELLKIAIAVDGDSEKRTSRTERIIKALKKLDFVKYIVTPEHIEKGSEEYEYLINKFPEAAGEVSAEGEIIYVIRL